MKPEDVKKVGVIGCGIMGSGIVEVCAKAGTEVTYVEVDDERVERGRARIQKSLDRALERGKLTEEDRGAVLGAIHGTADYEDIGDSDLVIEAATEHLDTKLDIFRTLDAITRDDIVLATNTSSLPIVQMATQTKRPDKVVGMHFFNPPPILKLIELIRAITTSDETMEFARGMAERLGKTVVVAKDRAGFIVNYLLTYYLNSAIRMLEEEFATKEDIDTAVKLGLGHPMGPFELLDLIGLDTMMAVAEVLYDEFRDPDVAPPPMARRMVHAGFLGRKSGKGFYDYSKS
ncbi:MAG TPA: 3-hydroxybutyryl-CoA dehydrogenase [Actinomycetota bacterium]|jgi:3-hydroxybutyryl-CoA dehydrogenase|nr:3-hydroxybutyryl-CoA dehydrogenase [Actinomycetota bacterium]